MVATPMLPTKFQFLKHLSISPPSYDYFSLVSFLDASPSLKTWLLDIRRFSFDPANMEQESIFGGSSQLRQMPEQHHGCLKSMTIFSRTCYILKNAKSLDCLRLDTTLGDPKCDSQPPGGECLEMDEDFVMEARRGAVAIRTYIQDKVPPTVKLTVVEHCRRCHLHADNLSE